MKGSHCTYGSLWKAYRDANPEETHAWVDEEAAKTWRAVKKDREALAKVLADLKLKKTQVKRKRLAFWQTAGAKKKAKKEAEPAPKHQQAVLPQLSLVEPQPEASSMRQNAELNNIERSAILDERTR